MLGADFLVEPALPTELSAADLDGAGPVVPSLDPSDCLRDLAEDSGGRTPPFYWMAQFVEMLPMLGVRFHATESTGW